MLGEPAACLSVISVLTIAYADRDRPTLNDAITSDFETGWSAISKQLNGKSYTIH